MGKGLRMDSGQEMKRSFRLLLIFSLLLFVICRPKTEEDRIHELLATLIRMAEEKDLASMMTYFAEDFTDFEGRTKTGIENFLAGYFSGRTGIVVHELSTRIENIQADRAAFQTEVALSSGAARALRRLIKLSPENYRIKVELVREKEGWLIRYAEWAEIALGELFPESLVSFKKLFSDKTR